MRWVLLFFNTTPCQPPVRFDPIVLCPVCLLPADLRVLSPIVGVKAGQSGPSTRAGPSSSGRSLVSGRAEWVDRLGRVVPFGPTALAGSCRSGRPLRPVMPTGSGRFSRPSQPGCAVLAGLSCRPGWPRGPTAPSAAGPCCPDRVSGPALVVPRLSEGHAVRARGVGRRSAGLLASLFS